MSFLSSAIPIIQAPMVGSGAELASAVCQAGGIGSIPSAALTPDRLRSEVEALRAATDAPFNLNFFCHAVPEVDPDIQRRWVALLAPYYAEAGLDISEAGSGPGRAPFDDGMCQVVEEVRPPIVSFHFGLPAPELLDRVKRTGAQIWSSATTVREAKWLVAQGVDAVIAQGVEAGGHRGMFLETDIDAQPGLFALLPQVVDAVDVPVIAAGGIADGRGVAAALMLGASAVQIGTAYLLTPQARRSALHRKALESATDDTTRLTNLYTGRPARGVVTRLMRDLGPMSAMAPPFPLATGAVDPVRLAFEKDGKDDLSVLWSGQAASLARWEDAGDLTRRLWTAARELNPRLPAPS